MSYSDSFPTQTPSLNLNFATGSDQFLDSRLSYSRSSSGTAFSAERHKSSENLVPYSNLSSGFSFGRTTLDSTNNSAPDGGSDAASILETAVSGGHEVYDTFAAVSGQQYSFVFYLKANGRTKVIFKPQATSVIAEITFDLTAVTSTVTSGSADSHSITAIGSTGWYKCAATVTATATGTGYTQFNLVDGTGASTYTGDVTKGVFAWGASVSTCGTVLNETSGSIHREFAATLKTSQSDQPRFEYDPTDGQSVGLLIEAQAENLQRYGSAFSSWGTRANLASYSNQAIAPNGQLEAGLLVPTTGNKNHYVYDGQASVTSGTTYTFSVFLKAAGYRYVQLLALSSLQGSGHVTYDLEAGTLSVSGAHTGTIESVGNGWFRASATVTATSTTTSGFLIAGADSLSNGRNPQTTGNAYDGLLAWGSQFEEGSSASSLANSGTSSSGVTRAADSCSVATSSFYTGGPVTIVGEVSGGSGTAALADLRDEDATMASYLLVWKASAANTDASNFKVYSKDSGNLQVNETVAGSGGATTIAARLDTNNFAACADGGTLVTDTSSVVLPSGLSKLWIASAMSGYQLDSNIKNLRFYNVALSDTELQAITS